VEALNKDKENVFLTNLELGNLKSSSLLNFEKFIKRTIEAKKKKLVDVNKEYQRNL
jgi:hypothetical protein